MSVYLPIRCEQFVGLPPQYCHLEQDPSNPCCQRPVCNFLVSHDVIAGLRNETLPPQTTTTLAPNAVDRTTFAPPRLGNFLYLIKTYLNTI